MERIDKNLERKQGRDGDGRQPKETIIRYINACAPLLAMTVTALLCVVYKRLWTST